MVSKRYRRKASAVVELAVVLPVVFTICFSLIEISRLLLLQHTADAAAYEGARQGMVPGATAGEAITAAKVLLDADGLKSTMVTVEPETLDESTAIITVAVQIPVAENSWLRFFCLGETTISSEMSLYCERPPVALLTGINEMKFKVKKSKEKAKGIGL